MATSGPERAGLDKAVSFRWLTRAAMSIIAAMAGASQRTAKQGRRPACSLKTRATFSTAAAANICCLTLGEGQRGAHERKSVSSSFISFIIVSFQAVFQFLQPIAVPAGGRIRGDFEDLPDLLESVFVPDLEDDHLALLARQPGQAFHRLSLGGAFLRQPLEPTQGFQLPGDPPPEPPTVIQGAVAEATDAVVLRLNRRFGKLHELHKCLLQNIFRFRVAKPECPAIEHQLR